ncbi:MAG TPA: adenylate/guanylate cyclase domain-containing protein [Acidimicrobiales bacterium]|nr:adenylate/guanylate cyclase domain-containing protein [Acidimicrobiales bacterium]
MSTWYVKNIDAPDETFRFQNGQQDAVDLGDVTVARITMQPGWRWSKDVRPLVGGEWCQARHVGILVAGGLDITLQDGTRFSVRPGDVFEIPPGHDGHASSDEVTVTYEWTGARAFAGFRVGGAGRILATLVFTDVVDSTALAARLGDRAWRDLLSQHLETARGAIDRFGGREVKTTGDGMLVTFESPASALGFGAAVCRAAAKEGLEIRVGVHVGEVEVVGSDVRGIAVHVAARVMSLAGPNEVLVSETARALSLSANVPLEPSGTHELKGVPGEWALFAYRPLAETT